MLPLRDNIPRRYSPYAVRVIIGINTLFFLYTLTLSERGFIRLIHILGMVPARFFHPAWADWAGYPDIGFLPFLTHMFLHSGFFHFVINMWILWVFADNIEDVTGPIRFVLFYLLCGLGALGGHLLFNADSTLPVVGASGAIAGVMGAYLLLYPQAQVLTLIPIFIFPFFVNLPAIVFLVLWFMIQVFSGLMASLQSGGAGGVAWWAHAFGFLAGMVLLPLFKNNERCYDCSIKLLKDKDSFRFF